MTEVVIDEQIKHTIKEPNNYNVIMLNDDMTPVDWVISLLQEMFRHDEASAHALTMDIHNNGSAVAGSFKFEIAEQKLADAVEASRNNGFPLGFTLEEDK